MATAVGDIETILAPFRAEVLAQGDLVRKLKAENADAAELKRAVTELKAKKKLLESKEQELTSQDSKFDRSKLENLLKQKFFYDQSFSIYGGINGLYDFGPMGCAVKTNILNYWRNFFVLNDHLLEVDCSILTPEPVLKASGHVDRFTDYMVKDLKTGECFRADHLIEGALETLLASKKTSEEDKIEIKRVLIQIDNYGPTEMDAIIKKYNIKTPLTNNNVSEPQQFNLMFATSIGPSGSVKGFLRPETAQGIFVNFQRLLNFNQGRIPFGVAQIGQAFRNEINPRAGLLRVREFTMAEIEYFIDPAETKFAKFCNVADTELAIFSACDQMDGKSPKLMKIRDAVEQGIIANETLGYFLARVHQFLINVGIRPNKLRFRQHMSNEMAHYARDCWDAECQTSYGWIECVGCADRSAYDLCQHAKATGVRLVAEKKLDEPRVVKTIECVLNKGIIGKTFKADAKAITEKLSGLSLDDSKILQAKLDTDGFAEITVNDCQHKVDPTMLQLKEQEVTLHVDEVMPNVIEPSFGIGRIMYCIFEQSFDMRENDEQRTYLSLAPIIAPYKCSLLPLSNQPVFTPLINEISTSLTAFGVSHRIDSSTGSIGRRYARTDQLAIPYGITIDFDSVNKEPPSATLRERDTMKQIRVELSELPKLISALTEQTTSWSEACTRFPAFEQQETSN